MFSDLWYRLRVLVRRTASEDKLDAELTFHFERQVEKNMRAGMAREEAIRQARIAFGGMTQIKEQCRYAWGTAFLDTLTQDIGYGARLVARNPSFSTTALLTLMLGIGATTAIFSLVHAVLLRPLPYRDPQRLVEIYEDHGGAGVGLAYDFDTPGGYADLKRQTQIFDDVAAVDGGNEFSLLADGGEARTVMDESVTWNLFPMLGVNPLYGRLFTEQEDRPEHEHVVLLSYRLWRDRFGGDRRILGHDIRLDNRVAVEKYTVIGIMPPHFAFPEKNADIWIPRAFTQQQLDSHGEHYLMVFARLKDRVTLLRANSDLQALADQARQLYPYERSLHKFFGERLQEAYTRDSRRGLLLLMTGVTFILLIACANLANLLLARSVARQREIGLRAALGASSNRLIRQLLTESALLGICGGVLGIGLAWTSFVFLKRLIPPDLSSTISLSMDLDVLGFVLLVSVFSSVLFGLAPALRLSNSDLNTALREGARGSVGAQDNKLGAALVVGEIALSLLLLVGAGLLLKSFLRLRSVDPGFRSDHVLIMGHFVKSPPDNPREFRERIQIFDRMLANVRGLPGVKYAGFTSQLPLGWAGGRAGFFPEGAAPNPTLYGANNRVITPGYFEAMREPLIRGRFFDQGDGPDAPPAVIINQTMARTFWPNQDAIGKRLKFGGEGSLSPWCQIVGIVGDVHQVDLSLPPGPEMYFPHWQALGNYMTPHQLVVESEGDPMGLSDALRHAIRSVDPDQPTDDIFPLDDLIDADVAPHRVQTALIGSLSLLALVIASIGIYGVMAYMVSQRTQEMGVRIALGAQRRAVLVLVLSRGAKIVTLGVVVGISAAAALTRLMQSLLFEVRPADPSILVGVSSLFIVVALVACIVPAQRAASVDPVRALRAE
jgi:putative ABC transport system permease protein